MKRDLRHHGYFLQRVKERGQCEKCLPVNDVCMTSFAGHWPQTVSLYTACTQGLAFNLYAGAATAITYQVEQTGKDQL